jgi:hypothetical protein
MRLQNWKKSWGKLPSKKKTEIVMSVLTLIILIYFIILLTIEKGML